MEEHLINGTLETDKFFTEEELEEMGKEALELLRVDLLASSVDKSGDVQEQDRQCKLPK